MSLSSTKEKLYLYNLKKELIIIFPSKTQFAKLIKSNTTTINTYIHNIENNNKLFRGYWYISNKILNKNKNPQIKDNSNLEFKSILTQLIDNKLTKNLFMFIIIRPKL